ncbi:NACHT domain-containing protein [Pectobacterium brasiliense]|uniref:NACHT domain-containing protein n=1 Tax=Pectobacterium brasiliense TaxID=180957 RepID=UPI0032EDCBBD
MEQYKDIIERISKQLDHLAKNTQKPLSEMANNYRILAESICKAIIIGHNQSPTGNLEKLISDAVKLIEKTESSRDAGLFKAEIKYLQNIGNTFSHDGSDSSLTTSEDQSKIFKSLTTIIWVTFYGQGDLDAPLLPRIVEESIPIRTLSRVKFENPRSQEVMKLCFPKNKTKVIVTLSDHANRLVYDYVTVDLGGLTKGVIFLRSRTALEKSFLDFYERFNTDLPDALDIVTPRAYRGDGGEIDRKRSIQDIIRDLPFRLQKYQVEYFDDFVWKNCLPEGFHNKAPIERISSNFIEQELEVPIDTIPRPGSIKTSQYIDNVLSVSHNFKPVQIITGPAGIGKTTFCDNISNHIGRLEKKYVVLISATDFRDITLTTTITTVSELYQTAVKNELIDSTVPIESHNFEINIACGNFVLIIDGFDELESHLGANLDFERFMQSLASLEECFRKVLVILTVRDYDTTRFKSFQNTNICKLRGFTEKNTDIYLAKRLKSEEVQQAKRLLRFFSNPEESDSHTTVPLYASLICDHLEESPSGSTILSEDVLKSKFLLAENPLDNLILKIIQREIAKQSLGLVDIDDFFEILIELIRAPQQTITKAALIDFINSCGADSNSINSVNFLRNPLLRWSEENISFKYDSLIYFFKARLLKNKLMSGKFSEQPSIEFISEGYRGEGPFYEELKNTLPPSNYAEEDSVISWFHQLLFFVERNNNSLLPWKKAVSAFLYWALSSCSDKNERKERLKKYFNGDRFNYFSIYDKFYPLDLKNASVSKGYLENYLSLPNCDFEPNKTTFFDSYIYFDDRYLPEKLDRSMFSPNCTLSSNLNASFDAQDTHKEIAFESLRDNVYKILKVGFKSNRFSWKSKDVYKKVTIIGKHSLDKYLKYLVETGVLNSINSQPGNEPGYSVSDDWVIDARKLVEEKNSTKRMQGVILAIPRSI